MNVEQIDGDIKRIEEKIRENAEVINRLLAESKVLENIVALLKHKRSELIFGDVV